MTCLILIPSDILGGAEQYLLLITKKLLCRGDIVYVFCLKKEISNAWHNLPNKNIKLFFSRKKREFNGIFFLIKIFLRIRNTKFDYAFTSHVHCSTFIGLLRKLKIITVKKHIARESTLVFKRFSGSKLIYIKTLYHIGYSKIDLLICQTKLMEIELKKVLPWLEKRIKIKTIPNPIDIVTIQKDAQKQFELPSIMFPYIISAGRLIKEKGFDILIEAFSKMHSVYPNLKLIILGEGIERNTLENIINKHELQNYVFLPGYFENIYPYLKHAELCVISSRIEGFPNTLLQMMALNTNIVSTLCAGGIEDLEGIFTCDTDNIEELKAAILNCLATNTNQYRSNFDKELVSRSIDNFLKKIEFLLHNK